MKKLQSFLAYLVTFIAVMTVGSLFGVDPTGAEALFVTGAVTLAWIASDLVEMRGGK